MRYRQPFDQSDPDAHYQNANPPLGLRGSILDILAVEYLQREVVTTISRYGLNPNDEDLTQLWQATRPLFGIDTGTKNAMVIDLNPPPPALTPGMTVRVKKIGTANDDVTSLDIGLGANWVRRADGSDLEADDLPANTIGEFIWDGSYWQYANFQGFVGGEHTTNNYTLTLPYAEDSGAQNAAVANFAPAITSVAAGDMVRVKLGFDITDASTLKVNALAPVAMVRGDGSPTQLLDGAVGQIMLLEFDGAVWQVINRNPASADFVPGCIYMWATETAPAGTLECDGRSLLRNTYARLFNRIGTRYGAADADHFYIPDMRGEFPRGWDHSRGADPGAGQRTNRGDGTAGDNIGTKQSSAVKASDLSGGNLTLNYPKYNPGGVAGDYETPIGNTAGGGGMYSLGYHSPGGFMGLEPTYGAGQINYIKGAFTIENSTSGVETRPRNVALMFVIAV